MKSSNNCKVEDLLLYAVTDRYWLEGRTLTEEEVTKTFEKIISDVTSKLDAKLRDN